MHLATLSFQLRSATSRRLHGVNDLNITVAVIVMEPPWLLVGLTVMFRSGVILPLGDGCDDDSLIYPLFDSKVGLVM